MPALPVIPGVSPEILQLFQFMQQQTKAILDASERRAEKRAERQAEENATVLRLMQKALDMLHPEWPHQNYSKAKANAVSESKSLTKSPPDWLTRMCDKAKSKTGAQITRNTNQDNTGEHKEPLSPYAESILSSKLELEESASPVRSNSMQANQDSAQNPTQEEKLEPLATGHSP